ncbi:hypothetical protein HDU97_009873 [Phlyctochytrium planicorne]|nr:hypothetical protein HDU97_009873 [Phlyctochytrium planicorne]
MLLLLLASLSVPAAARFPITSLSIGENGVGYATDIDNNMWTTDEPNGLAWQQIKGKAYYITAYPPGRIAALGIDHLPDYRNFPATDTWKSFGFDVPMDKIATNRQGNLWFIGSKSLYVMDPATNKIILGDTGSKGSVQDLAVRDRIYTVNDVNRICSRSFAQEDWICIKNTINIEKLTVSDKVLYAMTPDGDLYATLLPFTPQSTLFDTNVRLPGARFLDMPLFSNNPVVITATGFVDSTFCMRDFSKTNCYSIPGEQKPPPPPDTNPSPDPNPNPAPTQSSPEPTTSPDPNISSPKSPEPNPNAPNSSATDPQTIVKTDVQTAFHTIVIAPTDRPSVVDPGSSSNSSIPIVASVAGVAVFIAIIAVVALIVVRKRRGTRKAPDRLSPAMDRPIPPPTQPQSPPNVWGDSPTTFRPPTGSLRSDHRDSIQSDMTVTHEASLYRQASQSHSSMRYGTSSLHRSTSFSESIQPHPLRRFHTDFDVPPVYVFNGKKEWGDDKMGDDKKDESDGYSRRSSGVEKVPLPW